MAMLPTSYPFWAIDTDGDKVEVLAERDGVLFGITHVRKSHVAMQYTPDRLTPITQDVVVIAANIKAMPTTEDMSFAFAYALILAEAVRRSTTLPLPLRQIACKALENYLPKELA